MTSPRDVFPLRFKNPGTREALRHLSEQTGIPMTDIAERAIEHEVALQGADLERRLEEALAVVRSYTPGRDLDAYLAEVEAGEQGDLGPEMTAAHAAVAPSPDRPFEAMVPDPLGVLAAFRKA